MQSLTEHRKECGNGFTLSYLTTRGVKTWFLAVELVQILKSTRTQKCLSFQHLMTDDVASPEVIDLVNEVTCAV